jgi:hypothetical protein
MADLKYTPYTPDEVKKIDIKDFEVGKEGETNIFFEKGKLSFISWEGDWNPREVKTTFNEEYCENLLNAMTNYFKSGKKRAYLLQKTIDKLESDIVNYDETTFINGEETWEKEYWKDCLDDYNKKVERIKILKKEQSKLLGELL